jgi:1,4-alpha-glucan branching enzyme
MFDLEKLKEVLDPRRQGYEATTNVINYLATHDRERVFRELGERGIFDEAAFRQVKLGNEFILALPEYAAKVFVWQPIR